MWWGTVVERGIIITVFSIAAMVRPVITHTVIASVVGYLFFLSSLGHAQNSGPFFKYGGNWAGSGFLYLSDETKERIRCQAKFTPSNTLDLQIALRCAGDSYNFNVQSDLNYVRGAVSGGWNESTLGIDGDVSGQMNGDNIRAVIESLSFRATFELILVGDRQQIKIQSPGSQISSVVIWLNRISR